MLTEATSLIQMWHKIPIIHLCIFNISLLIRMYLNNFPHNSRKIF
jgi:hypothetical protein